MTSASSPASSTGELYRQSQASTERQECASPKWLGSNWNKVPARKDGQSAREPITTVPVKIYP